MIKLGAILSEHYKLESEKFKKKLVCFNSVY